MTITIIHYVDEQENNRQVQQYDSLGFHINSTIYFPHGFSSLFLEKKYDSEGFCIESISRPQGNYQSWEDKSVYTKDESGLVVIETKTRDGVLTAEEYMTIIIL